MPSWVVPIPRQTLWIEIPPAEDNYFGTVLESWLEIFKLCYKKSVLWLLSGKISKTMTRFVSLRYNVNHSIISFISLGMLPFIVWSPPWLMWQMGTYFSLCFKFSNSVKPTYTGTEYCKNCTKSVAFRHHFKVICFLLLIYCLSS